MPIKKTLDRIPGGMVIVPLFLGILINTLAPNSLRIGGFTEGLFLLMGLFQLFGFFFVCVGAEINIKTAKGALAKGTTMLVSKMDHWCGIGYRWLFTSWLKWFVLRSCSACNNCSYDK